MPTQPSSTATDAACWAHDQNNLLQVAFCLVEALRPPLEADAIASQKLEALNRVLADLTHMNKSMLRGFRDDGLAVRATDADLEDGVVLDPDAVIRRTVALAQPLAPQGVRIEPRLGATGAVLRVPEVRLQQVVFNLLKNAVEAVPASGNVVVESGIESQALCVTITDNGPGIPTGLRLRLFQCGGTSKAEGHGLGLYNIQKILHLYGGSMTLEDGQVCGTRATLLWPFGAADPA